MATETKNLKLEQIRIDGGTQPRVAIDEQVVADYADLYANGVNLPPVTVFFDGAAYWLADGFHRFLANKRIDCEFIFAEVHQGTQRDAQWYSFGANSEHGLRRTREDVAHILKALLADEEWAKATIHEIARHTGIPKSTVHDHRQRILSEPGKYDSGERTFIHPKTGKPTTMDTSNIGRRRSSADSSPPRRIVTREEYEAEAAAEAGADAAPPRLQAPSRAIDKAYEAIAVLRSILPTDPRRTEALHQVRDWINDELGRTRSTPKSTR